MQLGKPPSPVTLIDLPRESRPLACDQTMRMLRARRAGCGYGGGTAEIEDIMSGGNTALPEISA